MIRTITPFRITLILDGENAVAQLEQMERVIDDDGSTVLSARALPAEALPFPLAKKFLDKVTAEALEAAEKLTAKLAKKEAEKAAALAEKEAEKAALAGELAEKDESLATLDAMKAAIADASLDDAATVAAIAAKIVEAETPKKERRRAELRRIIAEAEAELEAGKGKGQP